MNPPPGSSKGKGKGKGKATPLQGDEFRSVLGSRSIKSLGVKLMAHLLELEDNE